MDYPHDFQLMNSYQEGQQQELIFRTAQSKLVREVIESQRRMTQVIASIFLRLGRFLENLGYRLRNKYGDTTITEWKTQDNPS